MPKTIPTYPEFPKKNFRTIENYVDNLTKEISSFEKNVATFKSNRGSGANAELASRIDYLQKLSRRSKIIREVLSKDIVEKMDEIKNYLGTIKTVVSEDGMIAEISRITHEIRDLKDDDVIDDVEKYSRIVSLLDSMKKTTDSSISGVTNVEERLGQLINDLIHMQRRIRNETNVTEFATLTKEIRRIVLAINFRSDEEQTSAIRLFNEMEDTIRNMDNASRKTLNDLKEIMNHLKCVKLKLGGAWKNNLVSINEKLQLVQSQF